jgi:hypothetical protein
MAISQGKLTDPQTLTFYVSAVNALPNGKSTLSMIDGTVLSLQPDLTWQTRSAGTAGAFEQCDVAGQCATYWYVWDNKLVGPVSVAFLKVTKAAQ